MKEVYYRDSILPLRYHLSRREIETIATTELRKAKCLPDSPREIPLEEFLMARHNGLTPQPAPLGRDIMGLADLQDPANPAIFISTSVMDGPEHRYRSTLAHEIGHLLLHSHLYLEPEFTASLKRWRSGDADNHTITCFHRDIQDSPSGSYNPSNPFAHIELQANACMAVLLTPLSLVKKSVASWTSSRPLRGGGCETVFDETRRREAVSCISTTFNVSPTLASFRLQEIYPSN
ncbi:MAG: ImmA/IrrE family metallo-endopeptidase [Chthoniobacterales bacterium]|nr:ImmA/IrrE family metallo-endopeptidase [Chthoniobacterales bacterium]